MARHKTPPQTRGSHDPTAWAPHGSSEKQCQRLPTTEVPDFEALHERERRRLDRRKYQNRYVTQPEPFIFNAPSRTRNRQSSLPKDPTRDHRWQRPGSARSGHGSLASRRAHSAERSRGHFTVKQLERPPAVVPPRTTEKTLQAQRLVARQIEERRELERQEKEDLLSRPEGNASLEMRMRVRTSVGSHEPYEERIDRLTIEKRRSTAGVMHTKYQDLRRMHDRVNNRPLLMDQSDSLLRARRRGLFRVRQVLAGAGVKDIDSHFTDQQLQDLDRAADDEDC